MMILLSTSWMTLLSDFRSKWDARLFHLSEPYNPSEETTLPPPAKERETKIDKLDSLGDALQDLFHQGLLKKKLVPLPNDFICGKGHRLAHPGNVKYRAECSRLLPQFLSNPTGTVKKEVAMEIMGFAYDDQGGLFPRRSWYPRRVAHIDV
jgi:hypothetical protein